MTLYRYVGERTARYADAFPVQASSRPGYPQTIEPGEVFDEQPGTGLGGITATDWEQLADPREDDLPETLAELKAAAGLLKDWLYSKPYLLEVALGRLDQLIDVAVDLAILADDELPDIDRMNERRAVAFLNRLERQATEAPPADKDNKQPKGNGPARAVEALLGEESKEILAIARSTKTADDKAIAICEIDKRCLAWDSPKWSELLGVSAAAIRKGYFWKTYRPDRIAKERRGE